MFQLRFAYMLSVLYCLVQSLVLVGILVKMGETSVCDPTSVFFLYVTGTFILAAALHPQEFFCLIHGFTYFLCIPTMYMLLMIYAVTNLHVVSWGTREVKQTKTEKEMEEEKLAAKEASEQKKKGLKMPLLQTGKSASEKDGWTLRCGTCCSYVCCPHEVSSEERILELHRIISEMKRMESAFNTLIVEIQTKIEPTSARETFILLEQPPASDGQFPLNSTRQKKSINTNGNNGEIFIIYICNHIKMSVKFVH